MVKSESSTDKIRSKIFLEEAKKFSKLVQGHRKLLKAIGEL